MWVKEWNNDWNDIKVNNFLDWEIKKIEMMIEIKKEFWELIDYFLEYNESSWLYEHYLGKIIGEIQKIKDIQKIDVLLYYIKQKGKKDENINNKIKFQKLLSEIINIKDERLGKNLTKKSEKINKTQEKLFKIKWWDCWKYVFTKENYEYLWNDEYKISLDFLKWNNNSNSLNFGNYITIKYLWDNIMKYFDKEWKELWEITIVVIDWLNDIKNAVFQINNWKEKLEISLYLDFEKK